MIAARYSIIEGSRQPTLKVLLTTGYADAALERTDTAGSEFDTMPKPYKQKDLVRKVQAILDGATGAG